MSFSKINNYSISIDSSLEFKEEFSLYLSSFITTKILYEVDVKKIDTSASYDFTIESLPPDFIKSPKDSDLELIAEADPTSESAEVVNNLQSLSPIEQDSGLTTSLTLETILNTIVSYFRYFTVSTGMTKQTFWGLPDGVWFNTLPVLCEDILRCVDFGTPDNAPLMLLYPLFAFLRENILDVYSNFMEMRQEENDDDRQL